MDKFSIFTKKQEPVVRPISPQRSTSNTKADKQGAAYESDSDSTSSVYGTKADKSPTKKKKLYLHKYKAEWEKHEDFKKWIQPSSHSNQYFKCKICNKDYIGGIAAVKKHSFSKKHINNMSAMRGQTTLSKKVFSIPSDNIIKQNEIRIASFIAEHNIAINVSDHLTELVKSICLSGMEPSQVSKMSCDRTKCTAIINNVIGKASFENLVSDLKVKKFSLVVDESTDISSEKHLAIVVRYNNNFNIKDEFLGLILVKEATAQNLYNVIINFFTENNIPFKDNLVGFAADATEQMR